MWWFPLSIRLTSSRAASTTPGLWGPSLLRTSSLTALNRPRFLCLPPPLRTTPALARSPSGGEDAFSRLGLAASLHRSLAPSTKALWRGTRTPLQKRTEEVLRCTLGYTRSGAPARAGSLPNAVVMAAALWRRHAGVQMAGWASCTAMRQPLRAASTAHPSSKPEEAQEGAPKEESSAETDSGKEGKKKGGDEEGPVEKEPGFFAKVAKDTVNYPDIYNSMNFLHFMLFLIFCLVTTATTDELLFWKEQMSISDRFRPWAWFTHSLVTENFMAVSYSMMMLHSVGMPMIFAWGLRRTQLYILLTAGLSGAIMWAGNFLYVQRFRPEKPQEFQYGPWDVLYSLLVAQYLHLSISPVRAILSFHSWMKYASAVGTLYIWYYDWQPTLVGSIIGLVLCKTVPAFKVVAPKV